MREAVLAVPADWTGSRPGSVLQQSFWRHSHPQVCLLFQHTLVHCCLADCLLLDIGVLCRHGSSQEHI